MHPYGLQPRPIAQRTTFAFGYLHWLWHTRHLAELKPDPSQRSQWKVIKQWPDRPAHPAFRDRRDRIPEGHWRQFRQRPPYQPAKGASE